MLVFDQVDYYYRSRNPVLRQLSFEIRQGEFLSIIGGNGSGKSTLAKLMNGLLQPREGQVMLDHLNTRTPDDLGKIREQAGLVFQNPDNQFITTSVLDEVIFGLENLRVPRADMAGRANMALQAVHMEDYAEAMPHQLSGGQKQRVAVAAVVAMEPSIIIFDEATSMLDPQGRRDILELMNSLHRQGKTIIQITHHMDEILSSDRVLLLSRGEIAFDGSPSALFSSVSITEHQLSPPFAVRLHQALGLKAPLRADWKETVSALWATS
ncbi:energy-coupling factor transporter ATPase [Paenibacillus sp. LMG 31459]|uniref:Energy-coupling factor transporter ATPase n=1 Tax=Paenibacillus phytohabitans TaxID=2654978 RepID=A0ABX1YAW0_9BACL|nr:energy-coupling factor transporter ATPase [Paenibacillus phytohabitans]NOU78057.1 energy-coupling factor transporter ATPase [Paenibacillus phytohabitans]